MKRYIMIGLFSVSQLCVLGAQETTSNRLILTEETVESMVFSSFTYQKAKMDFEQAKRKKNGNMWNWLIPTTTVSTAIGSSRPVGTEGSTTVSTDGKWRGSIGFSAQLEISAWVEMEILRALEDYKSGKTSYKQSQDKAINSAKVAFYALIELLNQIAVSETSMALSQTVYNQTLSMFNSGLTDRVSMLQSQLSYYNAVNNNNTLLASYERELLLFKQLLGIDLAQEIALQGELQVVPALFNGDQMVADYLGQSYDYVKAQADFNSLKWRIIGTAGGLVNPYFGIGYSASRVGYSDSATNSITRLPRNSDAFTLEVGVRISLDSMMPWSKNGIQLLEGLDSYKIGKLVVDQTKISSQIAIQRYVSELNLYQQRISVVEQNVLISRESLRLIEIGYRQGLKDYADLQRAIQDNQSAELNLISTKLNYYKTLSDLSATIGVSINDLVNINQIK